MSQAEASSEHRETPAECQIGEDAPPSSLDPFLLFNRQIRTPRSGHSVSQLWMSTTGRSGKTTAEPGATIGAVRGAALVSLLIDGDKSRQDRDITAAKKNAADLGNDLIQ